MREGYGDAVATKRQARKNPIAAALAKLRAKKLSPARRSEIAAKAARARWGAPRKK
jgi:hypothetical protein